MTALEDTLFLAAPTFRSRAYAQAMAWAGVLPGVALLLPGDEPRWEGAPAVQVALDDAFGLRFAPGEVAERTLQGVGVRVERAATADVNSAAFLGQLREFEQRTVIYSGPGGVILRTAALQAGKRFLHVHGGWAPRYRGSTAFYYSFLQEGLIGATALWLSEELDGGPIIERRAYRPVPGIEIDRIQDPLARAHVLTRVLALRAGNGAYPSGTADSKAAMTYYVIHPVLKHLALRRLGALA